MKIRYLLLGLMICVAGAGTINSSEGSFGGQNQTPFLIFGYVLYEGGSPCNNPIVNITNTDTDAAWCTDVVPGYNYYHALLGGVNASVGDLLEFDVTDGTVFDTANHTVDLSDIESGGIFDFDMTLQSIAPRITGYAPESPVHDVENATRRFNITIDQVVDVTWLINGSPIHTNWSVTDASCTYTVGIGIWNISANASNENGTAMQEWIWNVTTLPPPNITSFAPKLPVAHDTENAARTFNIMIDQVVDVIWRINGTEVFNESYVNESSYTHTNATIGVWNVSAIASNVNGTDMQEWTRHVNPPSPTPPSPMFVICGEVFYEDNTNVDAPHVVVTNLNTGRKFVAYNRSGECFYQILTGASEMRTGDVLLINASKDGVLVGNGSVEHIVTLNESRSGAIRVDINQGRADLRVVEISRPPYIFDNATNTINATIANNGTAGSDGFNASLAVDGALADRVYAGSLGAGCAADVTFNWTPDRTGDHTLTVTADSDGEIDESDETNNGTSMDVFVGVPDFIVLDVIPDLEDCLIGDTVEIDATVANLGDMGEIVDVEFYDDGSLSITRTSEEWNELGLYASANDSITLMGALAIRVHFISTNFGSIDIYDKTGSKIGSVPTDATDYWTDWIPGDTLIMEEVNANFTIDKYQALIANETIHLNAGERRTVTALYKNATMGSHNLSVVIDPHSTIPEYDETNNSCAAQVYVESFDLAVLDIDVPLDDLYVDDVVNITAIIENHGTVDAGSFTVIFEDELVGGDVTIFNETLVPSLPANDSINITVPWNLTGMDTSIGNCTHNITVGIPLDASPSSRHWPKDDEDMTDNILPGWWDDVRIMAKYDFTVENVTVAPSEIREGGVVDITAIIGNHGHKGGNVSVGFYIDMGDAILGGDVVSLAYCDCLGAARGWSRDNVSDATGRYIRIGSRDVWVDVNGTNTTSITWNAFTAAENHTIMVVVDPDERLDEYNPAPGIEADTNDIENGDFGNNMQSCSLNITPPDLSITSISLDPAQPEVGDLVNITAVIKNNENIQANSTLWWVVEWDEPIRADFTYPRTWDPWLATYPGGIMMRAHFEHLELRYHGDLTWVEVIVGDERVYHKTASFSDENFWTPWGLGSTLEVRAFTYGQQNLQGRINFTIDKYQVVIDERVITLNASESYSTIWNATVMPGRYTVWVDVEDQNKSNNTILGGTDLAVTDLSVPDELWDGDNVSIDVTITNLGKMDAGGFLVNITDRWTNCSSYGEPVAERYVSGLDTGDSRIISVPWTASLKNGTHVSHNHTLQVEVAPDDTLPEIRWENNVNKTEVYVNTSRDFSVTNLIFTVNNETRAPDHTGMVCLTLGENVTMNATVDTINHANCSGSVDVGFYLDDFYWSDPTKNLIGIETMSFNTGRNYAELEWTIDEAGNHSIIVVADPHNETFEFNESDNELDPQEIHIRAPDLAVEEITFDPENPEVGEMVNITARVGNLGDWGASDATVRFMDESFTDGEIHAVEYMLDSPHPVPDKYDHTWTVSHPGAHKMRVHFTKIDLNVNTNLYVNEDGSWWINRTNWTTDWFDGDVITIWLYSSQGESWGFNMDRYEYMGRMDDVQTSLDPGDSKSITVRWNATPAGEHIMTAVIDPDGIITEHDESNNRQTGTILVQGADLTVLNLTLTVNGSTATQIKHGDVVNITVTIANIGVRDAHNISVGFFVGVDGVDQINRTNISLNKNTSIDLSTLWDATPGYHTITVVADCDNTISETSESNNTLTEDVYVCAAELSGSISWQPPAPLDEDIVTINATITNSGCVLAEDFTVLMFYDYTPERFHGSIELIDKSPLWWDKNVYYDGAEWIYVYIAWHTDLDAGDVIITDKDGTKARPDKTGFVLVRGDAVNVHARTGGGDAFEIQFYPDCAGNPSKVERLNVGQRTNISLVKQVTSRNHTITLIIDPENDISESIETDNTASEIMNVKPTRDFVVMNVTAAETNLSDTDITNITTTVANIGFRNGTTDVIFVDYERERRTHPYWFDKRIAGEADGRYRPPYAPVSPPVDQTRLLPTITIHRPGADAIEIDDFTYSVWKEDYRPRGEIWVCDGAGERVWYYGGAGWGTNFGGAIPRVEGDTATIHAVGTSDRTLHGYTVIHEFNRTEVALNATETWNESRTLTSIWNASTGDHTITIATDPDDETGEIDESNNNKSIPIHVNASRDPVILNLTHTPLHPMDGDDVVITAVVRNNGDKTANFTIDFWENTSKRYKAMSPVISVPGASFVNIHLKYIREQLFSPEYNCVPIDDIWLGGSIGDTLETGTHGTYKTVCGMITCPDHDWHDHVDRIGYMKLLNRTHVTLLAPNKTRNVTAIWEEMSIKDDPEYSVIVIVDPEDGIDEINESNNAMECEIFMKHPDFEIGHFESPTKDGGARVPIRNTGIGGADEVNVTFELSRRDDCRLRGGSRTTYTVWHDKKHPDDPDADHIRVHFDNISVGDGGNIKIAKSIRELYKMDCVIKKYIEDVENIWSPWVEGDKLAIGCNAKSFRIDMYEWGDVEEETIDHIGGGRSDDLAIPEEWVWEYTEPMNLTVRVDPDDDIPEMDEENNDETVLMYADLAADRIEFVSPKCDKLSLDAEKFVIDGYITNGGGDRDDMVFPVSDFNVTLEFRKYSNDTVGKVVFNTTKRVEDPIYGGEDEEYTIRFEFDPDEEFEVGGNYTVRLIADTSGDICESNDVYPKEKDKYRLGIYNNITTYRRPMRGDWVEYVHIYNSSGYTGGGELINVAQGEVHGRVVYTVGDSGDFDPSDVAVYTVNFDDVIPESVDVEDIELARLFAYWYTWHKDESGRFIPVLLDLDMGFNDIHNLNKAGNYSDNPGATTRNVGYGLYTYDVTNYIREGSNVATATRGDPRGISDGRYDSGIRAIGLLVVYKDENEPLTKYWINEGADVQLAKYDGDFDTGLLYSECIAHAHFKDVESDDLDGVDARLLTILGTNTRNTLYPDAGGEGDMLWFNDYQIGTPIAGTNQQHYWEHLNLSSVSVTRNLWDDVTDYLKRGNNEAAIGSRGNYIMPVNAFLRLIFPPDLTIINLTAPASTVVGAHHPINATIRNDGRSDAHDFNVTFYIDGKQMVRRSGHDLPAGENMTIHLYNWTPMMLGHVYNLTAAADVLSGADWTEIETDNNAMTKRVLIEEGGFGNQTGPRGIGGGSNPTGGEYTEKITGRVMQGMKEFLSMGGGGGAGMFSLTEWIMKGAVWLTLLLFVCIGYLMEQRSYGRASQGLGSRIV